MLRSDVFEYTIETDLDLELPYVIMVWAFTSNGDQEAARYEIQPAIGEEKNKRRRFWNKRERKRENLETVYRQFSLCSVH